MQEVTSLPDIKVCRVRGCSKFPTTTFSESKSQVNDFHSCYSQGDFFFQINFRFSRPLSIRMTSFADSEFHILFVSLSLAIIPLAGVVFSIYLTYLKWLESPFRGLPYPPGPLPKNIISGNSSDIPRSRPWHTYAEWAKIYGKQCFNHIISSFIQ